ncbi:polysaccharide deacetylase family protein [Nostoc sp. UHCC 0302]|uniref:polysaccharide deacetylase family protein n=1 Tax=Nostoc sp. UHCC 0302 TaxID=3134896 RepID=UPI00311CA6B8
MTDNNLKRQQIISVVAIAFSVGACSTSPSTPPKLGFNQMTSKLADQANTQAKAHLQLPPVIKNPTFNVPAKYQSKIVYKVKPSNNEKVIALTIDDGPWQNTTLQMLDILKANNVKATFFWVGQALQANPNLAKREVAEGHAIGNHTWHHWYKQMNQATAQYEIEHTADLIYKTTGVKTTLFRPPGGFLNNGLAAYAKSQKETVIMWSLTSADTDPHAKPQAFVNNVLKGAKPGSIVLMHDGGGDRQRTVQALPEIINGLKQQGYRFVTVPELLKMQS